MQAGDPATTPGGERVLAPGVGILESCLTFTQVRSGGPGGQHVNTTASRVVLRFAFDDIRGLSASAAARLRALLGHRLAPSGVIHLTADENRSAVANRRDVLERLCAIVAQALVAPRPRRPTRPGAGAKRRRHADKAAQSERKSRRRGPGSGSDD